MRMFLFSVIGLVVILCGAVYAGVLSPKWVIPQAQNTQSLTTLSNGTAVDLEEVACTHRVQVSATWTTAPDTAVYRLMGSTDGTNYHNIKAPTALTSLTAAETSQTDNACFSRIRFDWHSTGASWGTPGSFSGTMTGITTSIGR